MFKVRRSRSVSSVFNHQVSNKVLFATDQGEGMPALRYQSRLWALLLFDSLACYSTCAHCLSCCCWLTCYQLHMSCPPTNQLINCFTCALNLSWLHARHMLCPQPFLQMWQRLVRTLTRFRQGDCFMSDITQSHIGQLTDVIPSAMPPTERAALPVAVTTTILAVPQRLKLYQSWQFLQMLTYPCHSDVSPDYLLRSASPVFLKLVSVKTVISPQIHWGPEYATAPMMPTCTKSHPDMTITPSTKI